MQSQEISRVIIIFCATAVAHNVKIIWELPDAVYAHLTPLYVFDCLLPLRDGNMIVTMLIVYHMTFWWIKNHVSVNHEGNHGKFAFCVN